MLRRPRTWLILLVLWGTILFILSHQSRLMPPGPDFKHMDKVYHATYFTIGGLLCFLWLRTRRPGMGFVVAMGITVLFCSAFGALDEVHQWFVPNRSGLDPGDWLADTVGGVLGSLIGQWVHSISRGRQGGRAA